MFTFVRLQLRLAIIPLIFFSTLSLSIVQASEPKAFKKVHPVEIIVPGKSMANADNIRAYQGQWKQLILDKGQWKQASTIKESLVSLDNDHWQHTQTSISGSSKSSARRKIRKSDLFTLTMEQKLPGGNGQPEKLSVRYEEKQIKRTLSMPGDKMIEQNATFPFDGYDGFIFGLALAAQPLSHGKQLRVPAVMPNLMNSYWVDVFVTDGGTVKTSDGKKREIWFVDTDWLNLHDGANYLPGPDNSGGRYEIFKQPVKGQPMVRRYKTDTVDIILE